MIRFLSNRWVHFTILSALVLASSLYNFSPDRWRSEINYAIFDQFNRAHPREKTDAIVIVDIDDASLARLGQWPWPRTIIAQWVDNLTQMGAKAIVFDGVLAEPDRSSPSVILKSLPRDHNFEMIETALSGLSDHDEILAEAIKRSGIFVSGFTLSSYAQTTRTPRLAQKFLMKQQVRNQFLGRTSRFSTAAVFVPILENAAAGNGSFMATPDSDGVIRKTSLVFTDGKTLYPSLSLEALRVAFSNKAYTKLSENKTESRSSLDTDFRIRIGESFEIPVEEDSEFYLHYRVFDESGDDYLSAHKVIYPEEFQGVEQKVRNKIVLIGSSAEGLKDLRSTALEPFQPGVEIHANAIEQIIQSRYLLRPGVVIAAEAIALLFAGITIVTLAPFVNVIFLGFFSAVLVGVSFFGASVAYLDYGLLLDPLYASLCIFLIFVTSVILTYLRTESERQQIRDAFGFYISPDYMRELTENPDKLKLGGEMRELSVMFTDIRNFTTISEGLDPEELIQLMNDFLTPMSDVVMNHKGTIDKYMGDAMMAFWNAPLDDEHHARNACLAALRMQEVLAPINEKVAARAKENGKTPILLQAGIGINSGPCAVGNMGSKQRFAYSTLGDAVNIASRLEGQTKNYGTSILIGEKTWRQVPELACLEADLIQVKGKTKPERIFMLMGTQDMQARQEFQEFSLLHASFIDIYRSGDFKKAKEILKTLKETTPYELTILYDIYAQRIDELLTNKPSDGWSGVYIAQSK